MIYLQTSTGTGTATSTSAHSVATKNGRRKCAPISDACAAGLTSVQQPEVSDASTDPTTAMTGIAVGHTHAHARSLAQQRINTGLRHIKRYTHASTKNLHDAPARVDILMGLLQLRFEHDTLQHATRFFVRSHTRSYTRFSGRRVLHVD